MFTKKTKNILRTAVTLLLILLLVACGGKEDQQSVSTLLEDAFKKQSEITSATLSGNFQLNLDFSDDMLNSMPPEDLFALEIFKNLQVNYKGAYQLDPLQMELILSMDLNFGDIKTTVSVPVLLNEEKLWVKIPNIPMVPGIDAIAGNFIEVSFAELAELTGEEIPNFKETMEQQAKLNNDVTTILLKHFEDDYFTKLDIKELNLPENLEAKNGYKFVLTQENLPTILTTVVEKIFPELLELMASDEYTAISGITKEDLEMVKDELDSIQQELDNNIDEFNKYVKISKGDLIFIENKNGFISKQVIDLLLDITPPEDEQIGTMKLGFKMEQELYNINETPSFEYTLPLEGENVIPFQEVFMMLMMMGFDSSFDDFDDYDHSIATSQELEDGADELFQELVFQLLEEPWFIENEEILALLESNYEFLDALNDPDILSLLLEDIDFRIAFFEEFGVTLSE